MALSGIAKEILSAGGWYGQRLSGEQLPGVLELCYHGLRSPSWHRDEPAFANLHVAPSTFEGHCEMLAETCHPISLDRWRAALAGARVLPDRPVLVTFDDGYQSVHDYARPVLKRHRIPAAMFVCSEPVRNRRLFPFDAEARGHGDALAAADDPLAPLTIDQLKELADDGFEIGVHTARHTRLASVDRARQLEELVTCRETLIDWIRGPVRAMAYPWGMRSTDYTVETVGIAAALDFDFGFTTNPAFATAAEPPLERSRFLMLSEVRPAELAHRIAYAWR